MPSSPYRPCCHPGCSKLLRRGEQCPTHPPTAGWKDERRGSRHARGYGSKWVKVRAYVLERDAGLCQPHRRAGQVVPGNQVDHRINKARWREERRPPELVDHPSNLECICPTCHKAKTQAEANGLQWSGPTDGLTTGSASPLVRVGFLRL